MMERKNIFLLFCLLFVVTSGTLAALQDDYVLAISDFTNSTGAFSMDKYETSLPEMLKTELSHSPDITVVERSKLESVYQELALAQAGMISSEEAMQVGQLAGARFVVTGELSKVAGRYRIDTHIVDVQTGKVFGEKVTGEGEAAMETMVRMLSNNIIVNLTGAGQYNSREYVKKCYAPWVLAAGVGTGIIAIMQNSTYHDHWDQYEQATRLHEFDDHYDKANQAYKTRNVMIGVTAGILTTGVIMWLNGKSTANQVLAFREPGTNPRSYAIMPYYQYQNGEIGIKLTVFSL